MDKKEFTFKEIMETNGWAEPLSRDENTTIPSETGTNLLIRFEGDHVYAQFFQICKDDREGNPTICIVQGLVSDLKQFESDVKKNYVAITVSS